MLFMVQFPKQKQPLKWGKIWSLTTCNISKSGLLHKCFPSNIQKFSEQLLVRTPEAAAIFQKKCYLSLSVFMKVVAILVQIQQWKLLNDMSNLFKLTIKISERRQSFCSYVFIVNFEHISHIVLVFPLLSLNKFITGGMKCFLIQSRYRNIKNKTKFRFFKYFIY